ncbi:hypothetical protein [Oceanicaulis sp. UBA2681]|mgnify:CR=1 FL=1|uniref:hypothetical protein n=1 Tax=Oceanicaulis sp. UBA2681 TaxID=1947007 RepID=UPI00257C2EBF|nr:hypothetical protein [Oceanicaulis sp. UBA2681]
MKFEAYDYIGVIVPGSILVVTASLLFPEWTSLLGASITLGDLGLVLILAFLAGHLLQAVGNLWETIVWSVMGGMPSSWPARVKTLLLSDDQLNRLDERLQADFSIDRTELADGRAMIREIMVRIKRQGDVERIERFNRNYGLMRGVAAGLLVAGLLVLVLESESWPIAVMLGVAAGVATYRMVRFGIHYGREMYVEYLSLPVPDTQQTDQSKASSGSKT